MMRHLRLWLAGILTAAALQLEPGAAMFPEQDDEEPITTEQLLGLILLHAEAIHGCEHTGDARRYLGMAGPHGEPA